ncbi:hypothetical protein Hanom_Chr00s000002g01600531 [Helianthus anomalus]
MILMKMTFRVAEDIEVETVKTPEAEIWYQDMKDVPSIELPERALVAAGMSLPWKTERHDKPVYVEDDMIVALYVLAYKRENGKMTTVQKGANEEPWYHQIVKNFELRKDADLSVQPSSDVDVLKEEKKKGTRLVSEPWCDYVVVSDTLEGLAPVAVRKPKLEPRDTACIPVSNPDDPIDLESSPEPLLRTKEVKRKQPKCEAVAQPAKKITRKRISKNDNLDAFSMKLSPGEPVPSIRVESSSVFNDDLPPSPPHTSIRKQLEGTKTVEAEVKKAVEVEKHVEVEVETESIVEAEKPDVGVTKPKSPEIVAHGPEMGKSILEEEVPVITIPSPSGTSAPPRDDVEENPIHACWGKNFSAYGSCILSLAWIKDPQEMVQVD